VLALQHSVAVPIVVVVVAAAAGSTIVPTTATVAITSAAAAAAVGRDLAQCPAAAAKEPAKLRKQTAQGREADERGLAPAAALHLRRSDD